MDELLLYFNNIYRSFPPHLTFEMLQMQNALIRRRVEIAMWCCWGRWGLKRGLTTNAIIRALHYDIRSSYIPFDTVVNERKNQAKKSLLIQVNSDKSFPELHTYCSQFGTVLGVHHYIISNSQHFMLVEFGNEENLSNLLSSANFTDDLEVIPVQSKFLWFRPLKKEARTKINDIINFTLSTKNIALDVTNGCRMPADRDIMQNMHKANNVSEQMEILHRMTCLNDLGTRLRYVTARQIESALIGLFPNATVNPFGSTVNGFGKIGCDLDLVMKFTSEDLKDNFRSRLVFHTKKSTLTGRTQQQRYMELISDMIQLFIPGCSHVRKILQARIPIIKYNQDYTGLECDLSISSTSGLYMSELLYLYGSMDSRVRPLIFTVRKWAQQVGLTNPSPGKWITNFPLSLMVLFFLQNATNGPIIPSFDFLKKHAGANDLRLTDDSVNCTFLRDIKNMKFESKNDSNLQELLYQFFEFYSSFDFSLEAISINEAKTLKKPDHAALHIINPLQTNLNVSKNVSFEECERMKIGFRNAAWYLESFSGIVNEKDHWGLGVLLKDETSPIQMKFIDYHRIVSVKDLFTDKDEETETNNNFSDIVNKDNSHDNAIEEKNVSETKPKTDFKDERVQREIQNIRKESAEVIKQSQLLNLNMFVRNRRRVKRR